MTARCTLVAAILAVLGALALGSGSATAALTHSPLAFTFPVGPGCGNSGPEDVAVAESTGTVYVVCDDLGKIEIRKFDLNGNPVDFSASAPYISANAITGDPADPAQGRFHDTITIDVANSAANDGDIFVSRAPAPAGSGGCNCLSVFTPSGKWLTDVRVEDQGTTFNATGVTVAADGSIYLSVDQGFGYGHVSKINPDFQEVRRLLVHNGNTNVRVDSTGAAWIGTNGGADLTKYEADQFTTNLQTSLFKIQGLGLTYASPSPFAPNPALPTQNSFSTFDLDPNNDDLYVHRSGSDLIIPYSPGNSTEPFHQDGPAFGAGVVSTGDFETPAVTGDGHVYVAAESDGVAVFPPGAIVPDLITPAPGIDDIGHTSATVHATLKRAGGPDITGCQIQYGPDPTYSGAGSGTVACGADAGSSFGDASVPVTGTLPGLTTGATYHYRFEATNANGANFGGDRTVTPAAVIKLRTLAADGIGDHNATLRGSFDPDNFPSTTYHFDYGLDTSYGQRTPDVLEGASTGTKAISTTIGALPSGRTFHYRIVATNGLGTTVGQDLTFRSASPPAVSGLRASDVTLDSAVLHARIDPVGYQTTYHFEYGTTPQYGASIPIPAEGSVGGGNAAQDVSAQIANLQPGATYHFRVLATNQWGTTTSEDTTFDFFPPGCPNSHVRQQTHTGYLPDCRAYELVSPGDAGAVLLFPSDEFPPLYAFFGGSLPPLWPANRGLATNPPRFAYLGGLGSAAGADAPNTLIDMYVATRSNTGWVTALPGLSGHDAAFTGRRECSDALDLCIDHNEGDLLANTPGQNAPYEFAADGTSLGQLPTNVGAISGGRSFSGDQRPSGDFSHFAFSSNGIKFAPDGIKEAPGSAYDNEIDTRSVVVISKLPDGHPIPAELDPNHNGGEYIKFPGISTDGSHILMQVNSADGGTNTLDGRVHLYMRVNDAITYDVSRGHGVDFVGMSADGTKVLFLAKQQLGDGDTDTSTDLYMWNEAGGADTLTRLSQGNGEGNSDLCNPSWGTGCDVSILSTEHGNPFGIVSVAGTDDQLARGSGDVYFYSPELLDPDNPGIPNQRNLYLYRGGAVRLVATLDPGTEIKRIQISPDAAHAALLTTSRLTGYDSQGFREMYTYDADTGSIRCASCRPDGLPPGGAVVASQGGPFMANDGRTFFTTPDSLVPQDTNGNVFDVYEYVDGRPQLITPGTGSRDFTGGSSVNSLFPGVHTGLESVSADGSDVFFSTFDSLVPQDRNGPFVKFYDARTGGGFDPPTAIAPCVAADECHGVANPARTAPAIASAADLGARGNTAPAKPHRKAKHRHHRPGKPHKRRHGGQRNG